MSVIDEQGRLFGRVNLIDAAVAVFVLGLIPLAYGTALLFQPARPRIDSVTRVDISNEERRIVAGGSLLAAKLKIKGTGFNPMLRASIGGSPALAFVFENPNSADVLVGPMPPGAHDLVLMDGVQEAARAAGAVVIDNPSTRTLHAEGWLTNLTPEMAAGFKAGTSFAPHQIVAIGPARPARSRIRMGALDADIPIDGRVERPAVLALQCDPQGADFRTGQEPCTIAGQAIAGMPLVTVVLPGNIGFSIAELFPPTAPTRGRVVIRVEEGTDAGPARTGDRDSLLDARAAVIAAASGRQLTLELGLDESREGWRYRGRLVTPGAPFVFSTGRYEIRGEVQAVNLVAPAGAKP